MKMGDELEHNFLIQLWLWQRDFSARREERLGDGGGELHSWIFLRKVGTSYIVIGRPTNLRFRYIMVNLTKFHQLQGLFDQPLNELIPESQGDISGEFPPQIQTHLLFWSDEHLIDPKHLVFFLKLLLHCCWWSVVSLKAHTHLLYCVNCDGFKNYLNLFW